jgi:hypothetical protein
MLKFKKPVFLSACTFTVGISIKINQESLNLDIEYNIITPFSNRKFNNNDLWMT